MLDFDVGQIKHNCREPSCLKQNVCCPECLLKARPWSVFRSTFALIWSAWRS
jgi:hypothetical protein